VTAYVYNTVYSELTVLIPLSLGDGSTATNKSRLCVTEQWPRQPHVYTK